MILDNLHALSICKDLIEEGANLSIYDPKVENYKIEKDLADQEINNNDYGTWEICSSIKESAFKSDAIVILTEWKEFYDINWHDLFGLMRKPSWIFDTRKCINYQKAKKAGFNIWEIGNSPLINK